MASLMDQTEQSLQEANPYDSLFEGVDTGGGNVTGGSFQGYTDVPASGENPYDSLFEGVDAEGSGTKYSIHGQPLDENGNPQPVLKPLSGGRDERGMPADITDYDGYIGNLMERQYTAAEKASRIDTQMYVNPDGSPMTYDQALEKYNSIDGKVYKLPDLLTANEDKQKLGLGDDTPGIKIAEVDGKRVIVPQPTRVVNLKGEDTAKVALTDKAIGAIMNGFRNLGETVVATGDVMQNSFREAAGVRPISGASWMKENVPSYPMGGTVDQVGGELLGAAVAGGAFAKTIGVIGSAVSKVPAAQSSTLGKALLLELGIDSSLDPTVDPVILGRNSLLATNLGFEAVSPTSPEQYSEQLVRNRYNMMLEGLALIGPTDEAIKAMGWAGGFFYEVVGKPIIKGVSYNEKKLAVARQIVNNFMQAEKISDPKVRDMYLKRGAQMLRDEMEKEYDTGLKGMQALVHERDSMEAIRQGMAKDPGALPGSQAVSIRAAEERARSANLPELQGKIGKLGDQVRDYGEQAQREFGADTSIEGTRKAVVRSGQEQVGAARSKLVDQELALEAAEKRFVDTLKNDPTFAPVLDQLEQSSGISMNITRDSGKTIIARLRKALNVMDDKKNELYNKIPATVNADGDSLAAVLSNEALPPKLRESVEAAKGPSGNYKFKKLYNETRLMAQDWLRRTNDPNQRAAIMDLLDNINVEQIDYLKDAAPSATKAIDAAKKYMKEEYSPLWRSGQMKDFYDAYKRYLPIDEASFVEKSAGVVDNVLKENLTSAPSQEILLKALTKDGDSPDVVVDYALGKVATKLRNNLGSGKAIGDLNEKVVSDSIQELSNVAYALKEGGHEASYQRVVDFVDQLRAGNVDRLRLDEAIKQGHKDFFELQTSVYNDDLKNFFKKEVGGVSERSNGYDIFRKYMEDDPSEITGLINRLDQTGNPQAKEGLKAAYFRYMNEKFFKASESVGGYRDFNTSAFKEIADGAANYKEVGKAIFKDNPEVIDAQFELLEVAADLARRRAAGAGSLVTPGEITKGLTGGTGSLITVFFGVLNKTAARIRAATGRAISSLDPTGELNMIYGELLSDPEELARMIDIIRKTDKPLSSPEVRKYVAKTVTRSLWFNNYRDEEGTPEMGSFQTIEQVYDIVSKTVNEEMTPSDQTDEALKSE